MTMASKRTLSLEEKIKVIEEHERNKRPARELITLFKVGKTQIYEILKNKNKIKDNWRNGKAGHMKRNAKSIEYEDINRAMFEWFVDVTGRGMPLSGSMIRIKALETAKSLGKLNFKASNGWLEKFKHRHNIVLNAACGETYDTRTLADWNGYDRTGLFLLSRM